VELSHRWPWNSSVSPSPFFIFCPMKTQSLDNFFHYCSVFFSLAALAFFDFSNYYLFLQQRTTTVSLSLIRPPHLLRSPALTQASPLSSRFPGSESRAA
jgi:hypothetical protein